MTTRLIRAIGELTTNDPSLGDGTAMGRLKDAAMVVDESRVLWVGANSHAPEADEVLDVAGAAVTPGFVDSHTHLVFSGERSDEFEARMAGEVYDGGGIVRTVEATRNASRAELMTASHARAAALRRSGVTTMEVKSGYDLTVEGEARLLDVAGTITTETTYLGAHVVAPEYAKDRDAYVALVAGAMLERCAPFARWADVFCDRGAFSVDEARTILLAARSAGLGLRLHGQQLGFTGGVALAAELGAASVDHCTYVSDDDLEALSASGTVATLLPGAEFATRAPYPSGRRFLDAGVSVAIATDCNPGTSYLTSMPLAMALAVREMGLSVDEALYGATRGGARALAREDLGHLGVGARADFLVLDAPRAAHLVYRLGDAVVATVECAGS
ncbi:MAG: imidazolonepropionase [Acidimicrobiales bacterium]